MFAFFGQDQSKKSRELEIKQKLLDIKSSAIKRTVSGSKACLARASETCSNLSQAGHLMRWLYDLEDLEEVWLPVASVAKERNLFVAREDNLREINENLEEQGKVLVALKEKMRTE